MKTPESFERALKILKGGKIPGADTIMRGFKDRKAAEAKLKQTETDRDDMAEECAARGISIRKAEESKALLTSIHANTLPAAIKKASKSAFKEARHEAKSGAKKPGGQAKGTSDQKRKALQKMHDLLDSGKAKSQREAAKLAHAECPLLSIGWGRLNNLFSDPEAQKKIGFERVRKMQKRKR